MHPERTPRRRIGLRFHAVHRHETHLYASVGPCRRHDRTGDRTGSGRPRFRSSQNETIARRLNSHAVFVLRIPDTEDQSASKIAFRPRFLDGATAPRDELRAIEMTFENPAEARVARTHFAQGGELGGTATPRDTPRVAFA
jgi:hypothetical protein